MHLSDKFAGRSAAEKIEQLRQDLQKAEASAIVISALDDVAWLLNLRGQDISYNPVFFSYAIVTLDQVTLFVNDQQIAGVTDYLKSLNIRIQPYESFIGELTQVSAGLRAASGSTKILVSESASAAIADAIGEGHYATVISPVTHAKAAKNETEMEGFRSCHIRDGVALVCCTMYDLLYADL